MLALGQWSDGVPRSGAPGEGVMVRRREERKCWIDSVLEIDPLSAFVQFSH